MESYFGGFPHPHIENHCSPKEAMKIDETKPFVHLDKELNRIYEKSNIKNRRADKLIKVFLKDGEERGILTHFEAQGYQEENYPKRMYTCSNRAEEMFDLDVAGFVIYTDSDKDFKPNKYEKHILGSRKLYEFTVYKVMEHTMEEYEAMDNPVAIAFQTALMAIKKNWKDEDLLKMKLYLYKRMLEKGYDRLTISRLSIFIQEYVQFNDKTYVDKYQKETYRILKEVKPMGLIELYNTEITKDARQAILVRGLDRGARIGKLKMKIEAIVKALEKQLSYQLIADIQGVKLAFVRTIERKIKEKKLKKLVIDLETCQLPKDFEDFDLAVKTMLTDIFLKYRFAITVIADAIGVDKEWVKQRKEFNKKKRLPLNGHSAI